MKNKILNFLIKYDGIWSFPIAVILFFLTSSLGFLIFGDVLIDTTIYQYIAQAASIMIGICFFVFLGMFFQFKDIHSEVNDNSFREKIKNDLTTWQKLKFYTFIFFSFFILFLVILKIILLPL